MAPTVLRIGKTRGKPASYMVALEKQVRVVSVPSGKRGLEAAASQPFDAVVVDAVSLATPGDRICQKLRRALPSTPILHIHPGPRETATSEADVMLFGLVGGRALCSSLDRLLNADQDEEIESGPFYMNVTRRILVVDGEETQLTPKQAELFAIFLRHPGQVMDRRRLMEHVWKTDYLGDTRTLDVHIRWIRQVIEQDSSRPRYLQTVRGVGYRLVLPQPVVTMPIHGVGSSS